MENFFARDSRIQDDTALRDLEKKVHFLLASVGYNGMFIDNTINNVALPLEIVQDAQEVARSDYDI